LLINLEINVTKVVFLFQEFDQAAEDVKNLNSTPADNDLLELYSLYKQAKVGDCNTGEKRAWENLNKFLM